MATTAQHWSAFPRMQSNIFFRSTGCYGVPSTHRGRGKLRLEKHSTMPQSTTAEHGAETTRMVKLQKCCRRAEEVARKIHHRGPSPESRDLWLKVASEAPSWNLDPGTEEDLQSVLAFCGRARGLLAAERISAAEDRSEAWTSWSKIQWSTQGKQEVYKFCRADQQGKVPLLQKEDGSLTGNYAEMDRLLREEWEHTFCLYASIPRPLWLAFEQRYGRYFPTPQPMQRTTITPEGLLEALRRMDPGTSIGPDGWRVSELKRLPRELLQRLCELLMSIEEKGGWPEALALGLVAPLPKGGGLGPGDIRPITITSVLYRPGRLFGSRN